ncbi:dodecin family protein [Peptococcaceae bacterium]|nr:dodecin family protein [Peptococcaceae bacterium]
MKKTQNLFVIEVLGESSESWRDAVQNAVSEAGKNLDHITGVELINLKANVEQGQLVGYQVNTKVFYAIP